MKTQRELNIRPNGFTIVELLVVIVVIGILTSIVTVAYSSVTRRAVNQSRHVEYKQWVNLFEVYKAQYGDYPSMPTGTSSVPISYCLGRGFPMGPGGPRCRDYQWDCNQLINSACTSFLESGSTALITELNKVGSISAVQKKPIDGTVGPYVEYYSWGIAIIGWFEGSDDDDCPTTADDTWSDGQRVSCAVFRDFN